MKERTITQRISINEDKPFYKLFLMVIVIITIALMIARFIFALIPQESLPVNLIYTLIDGKDKDFNILLIWMDNGLFEMYLPPASAPDFIGHLYLYHWYFIFWPFYLMPTLASYIVWDILRISSTIYITYRFYEITKDKKECVVFLVFCGIGYAVDMYYNNTNWLILFLLGLSYLQIEKDRKILSGILFTIASFKIYVLIYPFILVISKKIKLKEILYYLLPFFILFIPYIVNPNYFFQMLTNWNFSFETNVNIVLRVINVSAKLFEPAQLMFMSFLVIILVLNVNNNFVQNEKWKNRSLIIAAIGEAIMLTTYLIFLGIFALS